MDAARPWVRNSGEGRLGDGKGEERSLQHGSHHTSLPPLSFTSTACRPPFSILLSPFSHCCWLVCPVTPSTHQGELQCRSDRCLADTLSGDHMGSTCQGANGGRAAFFIFTAVWRAIWPFIPRLLSWARLMRQEGCHRGFAMLGVYRDDSIYILYVSSIQGSLISLSYFSVSGTFRQRMLSSRIQIKITSQPYPIWTVCAGERLCCLGKLNGFDNEIWWSL